MTGPGEDAAGHLRRQHRLLRERFYDCDRNMHGCLAKMYLADQRFGKNYDEMAPGLAQYVHDAILANTARAPR
jgi:hypothetical protein